MALATLQDVSIGYRGPALLDGVTWNVEAGERIGLLGRNGAGKSTLLRLLAGEESPDHGRVLLAPGTRVASLAQEAGALDGLVRDVIASGAPAAGPDDDPEAAWRRAERLAAEVRVDSAADFATLSVGLKRRALLARALCSRPDLLLLDEPTNHLDLESILWLEGLVARWSGTVVFVTHDRQFLRRVATRIAEIDRGRLFDWACDYDTFLDRKEQQLAAEAKQEALFDKRLAEEEAWIRRGIKARRTRNEGRVRALEQMRRQRSDRRDREGVARLAIDEGQRSGQLVVRAEGVAFAYNSRPVFEGLTTTVLRGDKVGVVGPNGAGKTTLLRVLLGELRPSAGAVRLGTNLEVAYFDQLRGQLDPESTPEQSVADGYDTVRVGGSVRHALGYLKDFLFTPDRARTPIGSLSGGERNRLLLAKLFTRPANVVVLDEPTNDLDAETLDLLESRLVDYEGTVLVVSHDREFLNNVVTSILALEGGTAGEYVGGYDDWVRQRDARIAAAQSPRSAVEAPPAPPRREDRSRRKLGFNETRELEALPGSIERLEQQLAAIHERMAEPGYYQQAPAEIAKHSAEAARLQEELDRCFARWEELESQRGAPG